MRWRRFTLWCSDHWLALTIVASVLALVGLSVWGLSQLESFYRIMQLATMPVWFLAMVIGSVLSALIYVSLLFGLFSKQKRKKIVGKKINVHFDDVIGIDEAKEEAWEVVELLKDRTRLSKVGGKILRGIMMQGPPGCGKTYLAKAIATEAGIPFLSLAASDFVEIFVGVGASRVRKLFKDARRLAFSHGACIVFIDELDAVGRSRSFSWMGGQETNSTLNSILVEMDGIQDSQESVVVIGATNAPEESLDAALMRPGRFDRKIYIDLPNLEGREKVFRYYLGKVQYDPNIDIPRLARRGVGKSPADIENIVKESALIATRNKRDRVTWDDLSESFERVDLGVKHRRTMTESEKKMTAYHEAGHLVVTYFLHPTSDVFKASIIGRRGALGVVYPVPREEFHTWSRERLLSEIKVSLGGYASERLVCGTSSSGVASDFQKALGVAHMMVWRFGMGGKYVGDWELLVDGDKGWGRLSESVRTDLNQETNSILQGCLKEVDELLARERTVLDRFASELIKREELEYDDIEAIFAEYGKARSQTESSVKKEEGK